MKTVQIKIAPDGGVTIDTQGFTGADCEKATKALEAAMGSKTGDKKKPDYFVSDETSNQQFA